MNKITIRSKYGTLSNHYGRNAVTLVGPELKVGDKAPDFSVLDNGLGPKN